MYTETYTHHDLKHNFTLHDPKDIPQNTVVHRIQEIAETTFWVCIVLRITSVIQLQWPKKVGTTLHNTKHGVDIATAARFRIVAII